MVSLDSTSTDAREPSSAAASYSREQRAAACGVRHIFKLTSNQWSGNKITISCQSEHQKVPPYPKHPRLAKHFFSSRKPMYLRVATVNTKGDVSGMPSMRPTEHPRTSPPGSTGAEHTPLYLSCVTRTYMLTLLLLLRCLRTFWCCILFSG